MLSRWAGADRYYYQMPTSCPPVHIKLCGDMEMQGLDLIVMAYNTPSGMDKLCFNLQYLPQVLTILKSLNAQSSHPHHIGEVKIEGLSNDRIKVSTSGHFEKNFIMKFTSLKDLVRALEEAQLFAYNYAKMLHMRDHILCSQQIKLQDDNYNSSNRTLNIARLITHYNSCIKERNCYVSWDVLIDNVVSKIKNGMS